MHTCLKIRTDPHINRFRHVRAAAGLKNLIKVWTNAVFKRLRVFAFWKKFIKTVFCALCSQYIKFEFEQIYHCKTGLAIFRYQYFIFFTKKNNLAEHNKRPQIHNDIVTACYSNRNVLKSNGQKMKLVGVVQRQSNRGSHKDNVAFFDAEGCIHA